jgi:hypothetical protein
MAEIIDVKELGKEVGKQLCLRAMHEYARNLDMDSRYQLVENAMLCENIDQELEFYKETLKGKFDVKI